jgi:hypothetical protein
MADAQHGKAKMPISGDSSRSAPGRQPMCDDAVGKEMVVH